MDLEQRVIEVTEIVSTARAMKFKDEKNLTYTLNKKKKDESPTMAFLDYQKMGDVAGKMIDIKYEESPWEFQGKPVVSRYIKMIEWAKPLEKMVKEVTKDLHEPIEEPTEILSQQPAEKPDWDAINAEKDAKYNARDAKKTKDIHKQVALKIAGYNLTEVARVDFEKEPKRLNDLANVITRFADED